MIVHWPTQARHSYENPKGSVAVQGTKLHSPARPQASPLRPAVPSSGVLLLVPQSPRLPQVCLLLSSARRSARRLGLAATRSAQIPFPSPGPQARTPPCLPPCWRGPFPAGKQQPRPRRQEAKPLLMLFLGASLRPPAAALALPGSGMPPSAPAQCPAGGGAQIPVSGGGGGGDRQFSLRRSSKRTRWLSPLPFPALSPPPGSPGISPRGVSPPPRCRFLGPRPGGSHCPRGGGSSSRPRLAAPGSVPAVPERRCRRHRRSPPPAALGPGWVELRCPRTSSHCSART